MPEGRAKRIAALAVGSPEAGSGTDGCAGAATSIGFAVPRHPLLTKAARSLARSAFPPDAARLARSERRFACIRGMTAESEAQPGADRPQPLQAEAASLCLVRAMAACCAAMARSKARAVPVPLPAPASAASSWRHDREAAPASPRAAARSSAVQTEIRRSDGIGDRRIDPAARCQPTLNRR